MINSYKIHRFAFLALLSLLASGCVSPHSNVQSVKSDDYSLYIKKLLVIIHPGIGTTVIGDSFDVKFHYLVSFCGVEPHFTYEDHKKLLVENSHTLLLSHPLPEQEEILFRQKDTEFAKTFKPDATLEIENVGAISKTITVNGTGGSPFLAGYVYDAILYDGVYSKKIWRALITLNIPAGPLADNSNPRASGESVATELFEKMKKDGVFQSCAAIN